MITDKQKQEFARLVLEHPASEAVREEVELRLFREFVRVDDARREVIADIIQNMELFFQQLQAIVDNAADLTETEDE